MKQLNLHHRKALLLALLAGTVLGSANGLASIRPVTSLNDSGAGSLREAIAASVNGDTINFSVAGTITLTNGELGIFQDLTINGPGAAILTVSGNHASRVFRMPGTVTISGLTISDGLVVGSPGQGGGIYNDGNLTLSNCVVGGNQAKAAMGSVGRRRVAAFTTAAAWRC